MTRFNVALLVSLGLTTGCFKSGPKSNDPNAGEYDGYYGEEGKGGDTADGPRDPNGPRARDTLGSRGAAPRKGKKLTAKNPPKDPEWTPPAFVPLPKLGVKSFSPTFGAPGTLVTINGGGFSDKAKVVVGGKTWEVVEATAGTIVARVPEGATSGVIQVKTGKLVRKSDGEFGALAADNTFGRPSAVAQRGLVADVYLVENEVSELPAFDDLGAPIGTLATDTIDAAPGRFAGFPAIGKGGDARPEWFALHFQGSVNVTEAGEYELCLNSDDGAQLYLEQSVIVDNDGVKEGAAEKCELVFMDPGEYRVDLLYFQATGDVALSWTWAKDGGRKMPVPVEVLFPPGG